MHKGQRLNSITHLLGVTASIAGLVILVVAASLKGDPWKIVSFSIYGSTLVLLYLCSVLHHSLKGKASRVFLIFDYHAIYLLIAGTYTPITLVTLRGVLGWWIFGVIWSLAVAGIVIDSFPQRGKRIIPIVIYLLMGWIAALALVPIRNAMPGHGFSMLLAGGVVYTIGLPLYLLDERLKHGHGIWHLFVLTASAIHYATVMLYIL